MEGEVALRLGLVIFLLLELFDFVFECVVEVFDFSLAEEVGGPLDLSLLVVTQQQVVGHLGARHSVKTAIFDDLAHQLFSLELVVCLPELLVSILQQLVEVVVVLGADLGVLQLDLLALGQELAPLLVFAGFLLPAASLPAELPVPRNGGSLGRTDLASLDLPQQGFMR